MKQRHIHHTHHTAHFSYPISHAQKIYSLVIYPLLIVFIVFVLVRIFSYVPQENNTSIGLLLLATLSTFGRLCAGYVLALIVAVPLSVLATARPFLERIFLPLFDILQSVPVLTFFPILIVIFVRFGLLNGAAIFILFLTMLGVLIFSVVGGLKIIPRDIIDAATVFKVKGFSYFRKIILPAIFPQLVTGSILAFAQGWNIIIVAEVLNVYLPPSLATHNLFGIGSVLVESASHGETVLFMTATTVLILVIAFLNYFLWQKLLHYAQRFRFE